MTDRSHAAGPEWLIGRTGTIPGGSVLNYYFYFFHLFCAGVQSWH